MSLTVDDVMRYWEVKNLTGFNPLSIADDDLLVFVRDAINTSEINIIRIRPTVNVVLSNCQVDTTGINLKLTKTLPGATMKLTLEFFTGTRNRLTATLSDGAPPGTWAADEGP